MAWNPEKNHKIEFRSVLVRNLVAEFRQQFRWRTLKLSFPVEQLNGTDPRHTGEGCGFSVYRMDELMRANNAARVADVKPLKADFGIGARSRRRPRQGECPVPPLTAES